MTKTWRKWQQILYCAYKKAATKANVVNNYIKLIFDSCMHKAVWKPIDLSSNQVIVTRL